MLIFPKGYVSKLSGRDTQLAIKTVKDTFQMKLGKALNLDRITAPIMVTKASGINDDLNGVERKVHFTMKNVEGEAEVVQSLAKWKRLALYRYGYKPGEGIYTDMNAIRRDDDVDNTHSLFVDQWDWCKVITAGDRNENYLRDTVEKIVRCISETNEAVKSVYPALTAQIKEKVFFISTQELEDRYPSLTPKQREDEITRLYGSVFISGIGGALRSGSKHDGRAPDYDDWQLNGDILVWNDVLGRALELSSMGIRVDAKSLREQLRIAGCEERESFPFHQGILSGELPLTIGGGIGQSRLCMTLLQKAHIGEVQCSVWPEEMRRECKENGMELL